MQNPRNFRKMAEDFQKNFSPEDLGCERLSLHPCLSRLKDLISGEKEVLERLSAEVGGDWSGETLKSNAGFLGALEREMTGHLAESVVKELRRSLNALLHMTRAGRDEATLNQAMMALFLLDKGATFDHPLVLGMFSEAVSTLIDSGNPATSDGLRLSRRSILEAFSSKKKLEFLHLTAADLVDLLVRAGDFPPEELIAALIARGEEVAPLLETLIAEYLIGLTAPGDFSPGLAVGPACAILGEVSPVPAQDTLIRCLRVDLSDQAAVALAKVGIGALPPLRAILEDPGADPETRVQAVTAMTYLAHLHPDTREIVVGIFKEGLNGVAEEADGEVCAWIISGLGALGASSDCEETIRSAFERGVVEQDEMSPQDAVAGNLDWLPVESAGGDVLGRFRYSDEAWGEGRSSEALSRFLGRISEPQEPVRVGARVGRNDPCPCGSGKKYKRCCGQ